VAADILVLDVGSSSLKAARFGPDGALRASVEAGYPPASAPHRQDPEGWWTAARAAIGGLGTTPVAAVALTGTMENLIPVDRAGRALGDAILYSDPCGADALAGMQAELDALAAADIVGNAPEPLMTAFKLAWLRTAQPEIYGRAAFFLPGAKDAVALRLTGRAVTDPVTATATGLMEIVGRRWSEPLLSAFGVLRSRLPEIVPANAVIGPVLPDSARDLGLDPAAGIIVVNGCGDAGATTLGSFCRASGDISLYLGTTGWLARVVDAAQAAARGPVYRLAHPSPDLLIEITPILSAGAATAWARKLFGLSDEAAERALAEVDAEPPDVLFLPYLAGERSPFMDSDVRGAFIGLDAAHAPASLYYAVLEGVGLAIRANLQVIDRHGTAPIRLVGGGSRSAIWPQMLADILARPISVARTADLATATGAFLIAAQALGLAHLGEPAADLIKPRQVRQTRTARLAAAFEQATAFARALKLARSGG